MVFEPFPALKRRYRLEAQLRENPKQEMATCHSEVSSYLLYLSTAPKQSVSKWVSTNQLLPVKTYLPIKAKFHMAKALPFGTTKPMACILSKPDLLSFTRTSMSMESLSRFDWTTPGMRGDWAMCNWSHQIPDMSWFQETKKEKCRSGRVVKTKWAIKALSWMVWLSDMKTRSKRR